MMYYLNLKVRQILNVVKATFDALLQLRSASMIAKERGISLNKVFNG